VLYVVAPDQDQPATAINACVIDHGKSRLATTRARVAQPLASEPTDQPQCQRQQPKDGYEREQHFQDVLALTEQHVEQYSSAKRAAAAREKPLTPLPATPPTEY
jgi:GrpB-like predicted nucleotidyltransferase (UPF0157 family)